MAVTRINNNQISDASAGNVYLGINASTKLQNYSVTAGKLANNITYGSDLTITGNLTIQGNTTTVDTTYTTIEDPTILLASNQTGSPSVDIGFVGERGTSNNIAFVWDESALEFVTVFTTTAESNTTISIGSYADFHTANANIGGNIVINGNASIVGSVIGNVSLAGNITMGNVLTGGQVSAAGNVTGGNIRTAGQVSATANITGGNILTGGLVSATSNITSSANIAGGNVLVTTTVSAASFTGTTVSVTGNVTGGNVLYGSGNVSGTGNVAAGFFLGNGSQLTGVTATSAGFPISAGNSNIAAVSNGNILVTVGGTANIVTFTSGGILTGGLVSATGNITSAANVAGANLIATTAVVTPTVIGTTVTVSSTGGLITLAPSSNVSVSSKNINNLAQPVQDNDAASKIYVDNRVSTQIAYHAAVVAATTTTLETASGGTIAYVEVNGAGNGIGAKLTTTGSFNLIDTANIQTANTRVLVKNQANGALNGVYSWANSTSLVRTSDADQYGPNSAEELSINDYFFVSSGNVNAGSAWIVDSPSGTITFGTSNIQFAQFSSSQTYSGGNGILFTGTVISAKTDNNTTAFDGGGNIIVKAGANLTTPNIGAATGTSVSVTANVTGGNLLTGGLISATSNITSAANVLSGNLIATTIVSGASHIGTIVSVTGNVTGGNILTGGLISATSNITSAANVAGGNLIATTIVSGASLIGTIVSVTANVTGGNLLTGGLISATSNITSAANISGANVLGTNISASGNITGANINTGGTGGLTFTGANINSNAARITINQTDSDVDFAVDGLSQGNVFYVDAGTKTASFGNSTQTTNSIVAFNANTSILFPVGNTAQRPGTGVTGMIRFNSTLNAVEIYDNSTWATVGTPAFTVVSDQQFNGDGTTVAFTLSAAATTNSAIVSINGIVQIPTSAYSISSTTLTFTEAPQQGDLIDVRVVTTTTQVTSISNSPGNAVIAVSPTTNQVSITGNVVPVANNSQSLGTSTAWWGTIYGTAVNAQYADLAEVYTADATYEPGTVLSFGGNKEVTLSSVASDARIAGVVSTNPSYVMNAMLESEHTATVALTGRVPTFVTGPVAKGDMMVSDGNGRAVACSTPAIGTVIGKALENHTGGDGVIEVVVGRL